MIPSSSNLQSHFTYYPRPCSSIQRTRASVATFRSTCGPWCHSLMGCGLPYAHSSPTNLMNFRRRTTLSWRYGRKYSRRTGYCRGKWWSGIMSLRPIYLCALVNNIRSCVKRRLASDLRRQYPTFGRTWKETCYGGLPGPKHARLRERLLRLEVIHGDTMRKQFPSVK